MTNRLDGNRPLPFDRDQLGRFVREAWVRWALTQTSPKPSWLVPYDNLSEPDKEADRQIGEAIARWTLVGDAASQAFNDRSDKLDRAARAVETWWLEQGQHSFDGAPAAIFALREALKP
jgi:hypothetical protein